MQVNTALDLRRMMAQRPLTEPDYNEIFKTMPAKEQKVFWSYYENKDINSPETFIGWLKKIGVLSDKKV